MTGWESARLLEMDRPEPGQPDILDRGKQMDRDNVKVDVLDAQPGDHFAFVATNGIRFCGLILKRELDLVRLQWDDGHESWTSLVVNEGTVEVTTKGNS